MGTLIGDELLPVGSTTTLFASFRGHIGNDRLGNKPFFSFTIGLTNIGFSIPFVVFSNAFTVLTFSSFFTWSSCKSSSLLDVDVV